MVKIYVDEREKLSQVPKHLIEYGATVIFKQLEIGDYIPAEGYIIERKRIDDLIRSVFQGRFFGQIKKLSSYPGKVFLLIEGDSNVLPRLTRNAKAVEAAVLTTIIYNDSIKLIYTRNAAHTAEVIYYIAKKLQSPKELGKAALPTYHKLRKPKDINLRDWQIYILASFPGIGPKLAEKLLDKFGSLREVLNASPYQLTRVEGITEDKARLIHSILDYGSKEEMNEGLSKYVDGER
jgi:DNA excision repair protein ERCC-4